MEEKAKVHWQPTERQAEALVQTAYEIGYGGARGGGKTDAGQAWLLYDIKHPQFRALVLRRNADDLKDWIDRAERMYAPTGAVKTGSPGDFKFPSGAIIRTGHLKDSNAYSKYQGHEYHRMVLEELTQIPSEDNYLKLLASCRSTIAELQPQVFSTFNPDGPGFYWVRKRFNISGIPTKPVHTTDPVTGLKRVFIPAKLGDNPHLSVNPQYKAFLDGLPDGLRQAWRDGSWDDPIIKGAYYTAELDQARREGRLKLCPFDPRLKVHTVWDLGMDDAMVIGFWQRTATDTRLINYYQNENFGIDHYIAKLEEFQRQHHYSYGKHFAPHDANKRELGTGQTLVQTARKLHIDFEVVPMVSVADGIQNVRLMFPRLYVSEPLCEQFVNGVRAYRREWDEQLLKYKDDPVHDWTSHPADMLRYAAAVEDDMTNEETKAYEPPPRQRESVFEGNPDLPERHPMMRGVDLGMM